MRGAVLIAALAALVACGASSLAASAAAATSSTSLTITYWPNGSDAGVKRTATLRCDPVGGTLARRVTACRKLDGLVNPFARPRMDLVCTQQYGGPDEALIAGTFEGRRVWVRLGLADGCQIARFNRLAFLVPGYVPAGAG